jgi:uncharacterized membrane protein YukC
MKQKVLGVLVILTGLAIAVFAYIELKPTKSFLDMSESEKKKFTLNQEKELNDIKNNPKLTTEQKDEAIRALNKKNMDIYTQEERKAMAESYVKELQAGNIKISFTPSELGVGLDFSYLKKV